MTVRTRFAPSPTGFLHIGGARTALFNRLLARANDGEFLLRIEDTDRARSTEAAVDAILEGMDWLGLTPDQPPLFQFARAERHREIAHDMLESGAAYKCYVTAEELADRREKGEALRAEAKADDGLSETERAAKRAEADTLLAPFRSPWRDGALRDAGEAPYTIRLRAPDEGEIMVEDHVQGRVSIGAYEIDDLVLLRADGTPTYMLAVVVDDHDMGINHVLRGDDHFRNTFRQLPIYWAMGWDVPTYAHVPLIHGQDGAKLSKRHGALGVSAYRDMGYLPEAVNNYLLRLGWSHGDKEIIPREEAERLFSLDGLNKAPARLDLDKLGAVNAHYIREADGDRLTALVISEIEGRRDLGAIDRERLRMAIPACRDRGQTIVELADSFDFLLNPRPLELNKGARKALNGEGLDHLAALRNEFSEMDTWSAKTLGEALHAFAEKRAVGFGRIGAPLRAAVTGGASAPDLALVLEWLGREEVLARIDDQIEAD